jgi:molybdopterin/thiamine biosynthesis adenylyltransferase
MIETRRHHQVFDPNGYHHHTHVVGCGGMGSHIATALIRMGVGRENCPLWLHDHDSYESHNLANQCIDNQAVGIKKVEALEQQLRFIVARAKIQPIPEKVDSETKFSGVVFLCLDDMGERKKIVEHCLEGNRDVKCVIETRMDAETGISFCFNPNNKHHMECWWAYWYPSNQTELAPGCGGPQSIISAIFGTSCLALKQLEIFARKKTRREVPNRIYTDFRYPQTVSERWSVDNKHFWY